MNVENIEFITAGYLEDLKYIQGQDKWEKLSLYFLLQDHHCLPSVLRSISKKNISVEQLR